MNEIRNYSNVFLNNQEKSSRGEVRRYLDVNENGSSVYQHARVTAKAVLGGKRIAVLPLL